MGFFTWRKGEVPENLKITQVYGIIFSSDGRVLVRIENRDKKHYSLPGGRPEVFDKNKEETLIRETLEEVNTEIKNIKMVGYQTITDQNGKLHVQVRMTALIDKIGEKQADPDNGQTYDRLLTTPERAIELLNWDCGKEQIMDAFEIAKEHYNFKTVSEVEEYV